jgi:hypothetical protein
MRQKRDRGFRAVAYRPVASPGPGGGRNPEEGVEALGPAPGGKGWDLCGGRAGTAAGARQGTRLFAGREREGLSGGSPRQGTRPLRPEPGKGTQRAFCGPAVSSTALAGCGRGRDGRAAEGEEVGRGRHGGATGVRRERQDPSRKSGRCVVPGGQTLAVFLTSPWPKFRTPQGPDRSSVVRNPRMTWTSNHADPRPPGSPRARHGDAGNSTLPPVFLLLSHRSGLCCGEKLSLYDGKAPQPAGPGRRVGPILTRPSRKPLFSHVLVTNPRGS